MRCMSVCQPIQFSYDSSISCPYNTVAVLVFVINVSAHWYPSFTNFTFIIFFIFLWWLSSSLCNVECSCVGLLMNGPLFMLLLLLAHSCFSSCVKILSNGSVSVCLCSWSQRYCSAEICVGFMCCLFCVTSLPVCVIQMWYDLSWWFWSPFPSITPWVHGLPSSCWTTKVDPMGIETYFLEYLCFCHLSFAFLLSLHDVSHHYLYQTVVY